MKSNRKAVKAEKKRERRRQKRERSARIRIAKQERKRAQKAARKQYTYNKRMAVYGEDNLFNRISGRTHRVAVQAVSNIRLSLSLRISWNYTRLLLSMCATELLLCLILAVGLEMYVLPPRRGGKRVSRRAERRPRGDGRRFPRPPPPISFTSGISSAAFPAFPGRGGTT